MNDLSTLSLPELAAKYNELTGESVIDRTNECDPLLPLTR